MKNIFILILLLVVSCKTAENTSSKIDETKIEQSDSIDGIVKRKHQPIEIKAEIGRIENLQTSSVQIIKSRIEGNKLYLKIGYSGGCAKHDFNVVGNPMISKSLPPIRSVELVHLNNGDTCREYIEQRLIVDISELAYRKENGSQIRLQFSGIEDMIMYAYSNE